MLFKIVDLLIQADNEAEARRVFTEATGQSCTNLMVQVLMSEGQRYMRITPNLMSMDTLDSLYNTCIRCIRDKYQDTNGAVQEITKYVNSLSESDLDGIFQALIETKYNETKPILILVQAMISNNITLPHSWIPEIQKHVSKFWIRLDYDTHEWYVDQDNLDLLHMITGKIVIPQLPETEQHIERLDTMSTLKRLVNSVNFSYETLYEFAEEHPAHNWVLEHYEYKQKLIREGQVIISNDIDGDRTVL